MARCSRSWKGVHHRGGDSRRLGVDREAYRVALGPFVLGVGSMPNERDSMSKLKQLIELRLRRGTSGRERKGARTKTEPDRAAARKVRKIRCTSRSTAHERSEAPANSLEITEAMCGK